MRTIQKTQLHDDHRQQQLAAGACRFMRLGAHILKQSRVPATDLYRPCRRVCQASGTGSSQERGSRASANVTRDAAICRRRLSQRR